MNIKEYGQLIETLSIYDDGTMVYALESEYEGTLLEVEV